jgi:hypothetical protein
MRAVKVCYIEIMNLDYKFQLFGDLNSATSKSFNWRKEIFQTTVVKESREDAKILKIILH